MSLFNSLDRNNVFAELNSPKMLQGVVTAPAARKAAAIANLGFTATLAELNAVADGSANTQVVAAAGGAITLPADGGKILIPLVTANVTCTLPIPALGMKYEFIFIGTAADAEDWVITTAATSFFVGGLPFVDVGGTNAAVYANGTTHNTLTVNNPAAGCRVILVGISATQWAVYGIGSSADAPAFTAV